jgi:hypothetical protein
MRMQNWFNRGLAVTAIVASVVAALAAGCAAADPDTVYVEVEKVIDKTPRNSITGVVLESEEDGDKHGNLEITPAGMVAIGTTVTITASPETASPDDDNAEEAGGGGVYSGT